MLPFRSDKSNLSPLKKGTSPRVDCRSLFPAEHQTTPSPQTKRRFSHHDQFFKEARKSTQEIVHHGAPLPLIWVLVSDNIIPDYAVPLSEAYGGPQFIARAFLEGHYCIGKAGTGLPFGALINYADQQLTVEQYEVLCFATEMRWNVIQERQGCQQSSFVVSNAASYSQNSLCTTQTEFAASMLLDSDFLRIIPDNRTYQAMSMESSYDRAVDKRYSRLPLSPISRQAIEEICASEMEKAKVPALALRRRGCGSANVEVGQTRESSVKPPSRLLPGIEEVFKRIRRSSITTRSPRSTPPDLIINEEVSAPNLRTRSLSPMLSARLASSECGEVTSEQQTMDGLPRDARLALMYRTSDCLSPISHFSLPEPFTGSADPATAVGSPARRPRSIENIRYNNQDIGGEYPSRINCANSSVAVGVSSSLTSGRLSPALGRSKAGYRRSLLRAEYSEDNSSLSSLSDKEVGPNRRAPPIVRIPEQNRSLDTTTSAWAGTGSHERKPHARAALRETLVQRPPIRVMGSFVSTKPPLGNTESRAEDREVTSATTIVDRNRITQGSGVSGALSYGTSVVTESRSLVASGPSLEAAYQSSEDRLGYLRPRSSSLAAPSSPSHRIIPLEVNVEGRRGRRGFGVTTSERQSQMRAMDTISALGGAAVVATVASSHTNHSSVVSTPFPAMLTTNEDHGVTTLSTGYPSSTGTPTIQGQLRDASNTIRTQTTWSTGNGPAAQTCLERIALDKRVSEEPRVGIAAGDSRTVQYAERDTRSARSCGVSTRGTHAYEIETSGALPNDVIRIKPPKPDVLDDNESGSQELSHLRKGTSGRSAGLYDDTPSTVITMTRIGSRSQADTVSDFSLNALAQVTPETQHEEWTAAPLVVDKLLQGNRGSVSSMEDSRSGSRPASVSWAASMHIPDADYQSGIRERTGAMDTYSDRGEATSAASSTRQKYQVPLSHHLDPEGDTDRTLVRLREHKANGFQQTNEGIRQQCERNEESESTRVVHASNEATKTVANSDSSSSVVSKQEDSLLSAALATACITAIAFDAATESRHKERLEHAGAKPDQHDMLSRSHDSLVRPEPARITEVDRATSTIAEEHTVQRTTGAMLDESHINESSSVTGPSAERETGEHKKPVDQVGSRLAVSIADVRASASTAQSKGQFVPEDRTSTQQTNEMCSAESVSSVQTSQTQVELRPTPLRKGTRNDVYEQATDAVRLDMSHERGNDAPVESQRASVDFGTSVMLKSDDQEEHSKRSDEQVVWERKSITSECEASQSPMRPSSNITSQESTTVVASPQVFVNVQQSVSTVTATSNDAALSVVTTLDNRYEQRTESFSKESALETDKSCGDTGSNSPACLKPGSTQDHQLTSLTESSSAGSGRQSGTNFADCSLDLRLGLTAADINLSTKETTSIPAQLTPIATASPDQSTVVISAPSCVETRPTEQSERITTNEMQLGQVTVAHKSSTIRPDDTAIVQRSTSLVRSGHVRSITPRRASTIGPSMPYKAPESRRSRAPSMCSPGVEKYRAVGRPVALKAPLPEAKNTKEPANSMHGDTVASISEVQMKSEVTTSTEGFIGCRDTLSEVSEASVFGLSPNQESEKQVTVDCVDSAQVDIRKCELTETTKSSAEASINEISNALVRCETEEQIHEKEVQQPEAVRAAVTTSVVLGSTAREEQHEASVDSTTVTSLTENTSVTTNRTASQSIEVDCIATDSSGGDIGCSWNSDPNPVLHDDRKAPSKGSAVEVELLHQTTVEATTASVDHQSEQLEIHHSVGKDVRADNRRLSNGVISSQGPFEPKTPDANHDAENGGLANARLNALLPTPTGSVVEHDRMTGSATPATEQIAEMLTKPACVVAIASVIQQHKLESSEDSTRKQEKHDIHQQAILSAHEKSLSDHHTFSSDGNTLICTSEASSTEREQAIQKPDQPTSQQCIGEQVQTSSTSESALQEQCFLRSSSDTPSRTEQTRTVQEILASNDNRVAEPNPERVVKDITGSLRSDTKCHSSETMQGSHEDNLNVPDSSLSIDGCSSTPRPHVSHPSLSDSRPNNHSEMSGSSRFFCYSPENLSRAIVSTSPVDYPEPAIQNTSTTVDSDEIREDLAQSAVNVAENTQDERTQTMCAQTTSKVSIGYSEWQVSTWEGNKEPPPSYDDAVSINCNESSIQLLVASTGGDPLSLEHDTKDCGDEKATILSVTPSELQQRSEEGASALEQHPVFPRTCLRNLNESDTIESITDVLGLRRTTSNEVDSKCVFDQRIRLPSSKCLDGTTEAPDTQDPIENTSPSFTSSTEVHAALATVSEFQGCVVAAEKAVMHATDTSAAESIVTARNPIQVSTVVEEDSTHHQKSQGTVSSEMLDSHVTMTRLSTAMGTEKEEARELVIAALGGENTTTLESCATRIVRDDKSITVESVIQTESINSPSIGKDAENFALTLDAHDTLASLDKTEDHAVMTTSGQLSGWVEEEEVSVELSQEFPSQQGSDHTPGNMGPDDTRCRDSVESTAQDQTTTQEVQHPRSSLSVTNVGDKQSMITSLQDYTIQDERPIVMGCNIADGKSVRSELILCPVEKELGASKPEGSVDDTVMPTGRGQAVERVSSKLNHPPKDPVGRFGAEREEEWTAQSMLCERENILADDFDRFSTSRSSKVKETSTNPTESSAQINCDVEKLNETVLQYKVEQVQVMRDVSESASTVHGKGIGTAETLATIALGLCASDVTGSDSSPSKDKSRHSQVCVDTSSITQGIRPSSGDRSCSVPSSGTAPCPLTSLPTGNEILCESSSRGAHTEAQVAQNTEENRTPESSRSTHSSINQLAEVTNTFHCPGEILDVTEVAATGNEEMPYAVTRMRSHDHASSQETTDDGIPVSASGSFFITSKTIASSYQAEISRVRVSADCAESRKGLIRMDLCDIAKRGVSHQCLSRSNRARSSGNWMRISGKGQSESVGSNLVYRRYMSSAVAKIVRSMLIDVLCASRQAVIVTGWGELAFIRNMSLANRVAHIVDHRIFDVRPQTIVRTNSSGMAHRPTVIAIAGTIWRPFDEDALVSRILTCIVHLDVPQELSLLCVVPRKTEKMVEALNDTLDAIQDILEFDGIEVGNASVAELDMGYWISVTVQDLIWWEQAELPYDGEGDYEQGAAEEALSMETLKGPDTELDAASA